MIVIADEAQQSLDEIKDAENLILDYKVIVIAGAAQQSEDEIKRSSRKEDPSMPEIDEITR